MIAFLWFLVYIAMLPLPFIAAALLGGWLATAFSLYRSDSDAILVVVGMGAGFSLALVAPMLALFRKARKGSAKVRDNPVVWVLSAAVGLLVLFLTLAYMGNVRLTSA